MISYLSNTEQRIDRENAEYCIHRLAYDSAGTDCLDELSSLLQDGTAVRFDSAALFISLDLDDLEDAGHGDQIAAVRTALGYR